ncbi:hypothetical protein E4U53_005306 [Claviceps sorghi]|nr:hypothetical protein E4U53_005306 [Claviceps sorghi]
MPWKCKEWPLRGLAARGLNGRLRPLGYFQPQRAVDIWQSLGEADTASMLVPEEAADTEAVLIPDSREVPLGILGDTAPHPFDPVGLVAEMLSGHTGLAHIQRHPNPVEMADNSILAPIETMPCTMTRTGMAVLPNKSGSAADGGRAEAVCIAKTPRRNTLTGQREE